MFAALDGRTVCGPHRIMTEGDYVQIRLAKKLEGVAGDALRKLVANEEAEHERLRAARAAREREARWAREREYERRVRQDEELERQRQRRLAKQEMGKQQALRAKELHELANSIRLGEITHDPAKFERWLIRKGIITKEESVTGIKDGTITTTKGASK
jgi:hypothetical protein